MSESYDGAAMAQHMAHLHHRRERDEALLRQALEALTAHDYKNGTMYLRVHAIAALRARLGETT